MPTRSFCATDRARASGRGSGDSRPGATGLQLASRTGRSRGDRRGRARARPSRSPSRCRGRVSSRRSSPRMRRSARASSSSVAPAKARSISSEAPSSRARLVTARSSARRWERGSDRRGGARCPQRTASRCARSSSRPTMRTRPSGRRRSRSCALFQAMLGDVEASRRAAAAAWALIEEFDLTLLKGLYACDVGLAEMMAGDLDRAERELRRGHDLLVEIGDTGVRSTVDAILGDVLFLQGRDDEALDLAEESRSDRGERRSRLATPLAGAFALGFSGGAASTTRPGASRRGGRAGRADRLPRAEGTRPRRPRGGARAAGRPDEAAAAVERAIALHEQKGNVVSAARSRAVLNELRPRDPRRLRRDAGMPELRAREPGRGALLQCVRTRRCRAGAGARAAQGRHRPLLRPRRLDGARRVDRPRGAARAHAPLLRGSPHDPRASRRDGREVRRRRGHGGLRDPDLTRGRRAPRGPRRVGDARSDRRARARGADRRQHRRGRRRR